MEINSIKNFRNILKVLGKEIGIQGNMETKCCGTTLGQYHIIMELYETKSATIKELSELFELDKSTLSRTVDIMVNQGLLSRTENKTDRRFLVLTLTDKGLETAENINNLCNEFYGKLFELIPEGKHSSIIESLTLLIEGFKNLRENTIFTCCNNSKE